MTQQCYLTTLVDAASTHAYSLSIGRDLRLPSFTDEMKLANFLGGRPAVLTLRLDSTC
jgi:hypothetical protein